MIKEIMAIFELFKFHDERSAWNYEVGILFMRARDIY